MLLGYVEPKKYTNQEYTFIGELVWGSVPINRKATEESDMFKTKAPEILAKYPRLDVSFSSMYSWEHR